MFNWRISRVFKGVEIKIGEETFFLQAAMILHIFDLPQLCALLNVLTMHNSNDGCSFCNLGRGITLLLDENDAYSYATKYINAREGLPSMHQLRMHGITRNDRTSIDGLFSKDSIRIPDDENIKPFLSNQIDYRTIKLFDINNRNKRTKLYSNLLKDITKNDDFVWFGSDIAPYKAFEKYLYYLNCELSSYKSHVKTSNTDMENRETYRLDNNLKSYETVKGDSILSKFPNWDIRMNISVESAHALKGVLMANTFKQLWKYDKEDKMITSKIRKYYESMGVEMFPTLFKPEVPECSFNELDQKMAEATLCCVLIPKGLASKLRICKNLIFRNSSQIEIAHAITLFTTYSNLLLSASRNINHGYKSYYRYLSNVITRLRSTDPIKLDIDALFFRNTEFRSLTEGLFPVNISSFMHHALQDIAKDIRMHGPLVESHGLPGERFVGAQKRMVKVTGGGKFEQAAYKKSFAKESAVMKNFYGTFFTVLEATKETSILRLGKDEIIYYNPRINSLTNHQKHGYELEKFEFEQICNFIMKELKKYFNEDESRMLVESSFARVNNFIFKQLERGEGLYECFQRINNIFEKAENDNILRSLRNMPNRPNDEEFKILIEFIRKNQSLDPLSTCIKKLHTSRVYKTRETMKYKCIQYLSRTVTNWDKIDRLDNLLIYGEITSHYLLNICKNDFKLVFQDYFTFRSILQNIMQNLTICEYSLIQGKQHYGRGFRHSEKYYSNDQQPTNSFNDLKSHWFHDSNYSSWCKIEMDLYGQLNYFFSPNIPSDKIVSNLMIASVTRRSANIPNFYHKDKNSTSLKVLVIFLKSTTLISQNVGPNLILLT